MLIVELNNNGIKRRSKGERTRHQILAAAIKVLATNGIKGTTHRSIAKVADIQLSLTTYYFKDIEELITQAIILNTEITLASSDKCWLAIFKLIDSFDKATLKKASTKAALTEEITKIIVQYTQDKLINKSDELAVEQILFTQANINSDLNELANKHRNSSIEPYVKLCRYFNRKTAELDADILFTLIKQNKYRALTFEQNNILFDDFAKLLSRAISLIIK